MRHLTSLIVVGLCASPICALAAGPTGQSAQVSSQPITTAPNTAAVVTPDASARTAPTFAVLAAQCAPSIHVHTLSSLVRQESRLNPYAININGEAKLSRQPVNATEAVATARSLLDQGYNIDVGLGQINSNNFRAVGISLADLFEPCPNLQAAARMLQDCYERDVTAMGRGGQDALYAALSCYNTGSPGNGIRNGYVHAILAQARLPVPELLPVARGSDLNVPVPLRTNHAAGAAPMQDAAVSESAKVVQNSGEPDVFTASSDDDAFSEKPGKAEKSE